jgi:hypothetical protein
MVVGHEARKSRCSGKENEMASDADWVADVKRWTLARLRPAEPVAAPADSEEVALGYEAAQPALQACHWPDAVTTDR